MIPDAPTQPKPTRHTYRISDTGGEWGTVAVWAVSEDQGQAKLEKHLQNELEPRGTLRPLYNIEPITLQR